MTAMTHGEAVALLDAWLDTMRGADGYTGPVVHWWQNCLIFTGAAADWRYEGIIQGYLALYRRTGARGWLDKARRAGDDLIAAQLERGAYRHSAFELNPYSGGTPHEFAASLGLLALAEALRTEGSPDYRRYLTAAERNLESISIGMLWDTDGGYLRDHPEIPSFVPNKASTWSEALFRLAALTGDSRYIDVYAVPTMRKVLTFQRHDGALRGGVAQNWWRGRTIEKYFPYYAARCVPALLLTYDHTGDAAFADAALEAMRFVFRWQQDDGGFAQVVYGDGSVNRWQQWRAGIGDMLGAARRTLPLGLSVDLARSEAYLLASIPPSGGIATARGFGVQVSQRRPPPLPDFRDLLPVCGWADKAFRYLAETLPPDASLSPALLTPYSAVCMFRGRRLTYTETSAEIALSAPRETLYRWRKGDPWVTTCAPLLLWK